MSQQLEFKILNKILEDARQEQRQRAFSCMPKGQEVCFATCVAHVVTERLKELQDNPTQQEFFQ